MRVARALIPVTLMLGMLALPVPSNYGFGHLGHHAVTPKDAHVPDKGTQDQSQRALEGTNERPAG
jgi:hypothetical protein